MLQIHNLQVGFNSRDGFVHVLRGVDLNLPAGKVTGLVGETGCGKSLTALSIMRLLPREGRVLGGEVLFEGRNLLSLPDGEMQHVRGARIAMMFQQPRASLNPVFPISSQLTHLLRIHRNLGGHEASVMGETFLARVGLPDPPRVMRSYPHQLSGGMCQRVMLAMALACGSQVLVADEPTTALDVTVQQQIIELLKELQRDLGLTVLLITHDLGLVAEVCDEVNVMYAGRVVESASVNDLFACPAHPYSRGLMASRIKVGSREQPVGIGGHVPDPRRLPSGCPFHPRCSWAQDICVRIDPKTETVGPAHSTRCHRWRDVMVAPDRVELVQ